MNTSLTDIAILVMVDVLFISNFFFVRRLRRVVDKCVEDKENEFLNKLKRKINDAPVVQGFQGFFSKFQRATRKNDEEKTKRERAREIFHAVCFGEHRMEPSIEKRFPDWEPIPFKLGIISTVIALVISTIMLSENPLTKKLAISAQVYNTSGICSKMDFEQNMENFESGIENVTNYFEASKQFNETKKWNTFLKTAEGKEFENCNQQISNAIRNLCTLEQKVCFDDDQGLTLRCINFTVNLPDCETALEDNFVGNTIIANPPESENNMNQFEESIDSFEKLFKQVDFAGTAYSYYMCFALFFTTPIVLFSPPIDVRSKQFFCGVNKYTFIATVLILYWVYEYFYMLLLRLPLIRILFKYLVTDPCFLDRDLFFSRVKFVKDTCKDLINMENEWGLIDAKINLDVIGQCEGSPNIPNEFLRGFVGNETICTDPGYAVNEILNAKENDLQWWELWITSGLLAIILAKYSIANFGISLLKLADPFCICDGSYESPPEEMNQDLNEIEGGGDGEFLDVDRIVKDNKIAALKAIAFRQCLIWGLLSNFSLSALIIASSTENHDFSNRDWVVSGVIVGLTLLASLICFFFTKCSERIVDDYSTTGDVKLSSCLPRKKELQEQNKFQWPWEEEGKKQDHFQSPRKKEENGWNKFQFPWEKDEKKEDQIQSSNKTNQIKSPRKKEKKKQNHIKSNGKKEDQGENQLDMSRLAFP